MPTTRPISRRQFLKHSGITLIGLGLLPGLLPGSLHAQNHSATAQSASSQSATALLANKSNHKAIPSSGELLPVIGMGTWQTFNVGEDPVLRDRRVEVLKTFFTLGGGMIDCSPMYGSSADVLGYALNKLGMPSPLFAADKVWTRDGDDTKQEIVEQAARWQRQKMDLMQVHNLMAWQEHIDNMRNLKKEGLIRYLGVTTSHGRRHGELEDILAKTDLDFVQLTYNITHRSVEERLLPLAQERGIAVIVNRPFDGGYLIKPLQQKTAIPEWVKKELGYQTWADLLLGFIVSHPAVNCAIPATSQVAHMLENMTAGTRRLPSEKDRQRLVQLVQSI